MARPLRIEAPNTFYHTFSRGNEKREIFLGKSDYELFLSLLRECCRRYRVRVHSYCLMTNHFHLLLETREANLSQFMKHLLGVYTQKFNRQHERVGHLFQGRYKSFVVDQEAYLLELSRYIHLNPCRAGLEDSPEGYPWSSMRFYLTQNPPPYLETRMILSEFHLPSDYQKFVLEGLARSEDPFSRAIAGVFLGSPAFVEKFRPALTKSSSRDISRFREIERMDPEALNRLLVRGADDDLRIYGLWHWAKLRQTEIGQRLGKTRSAICHSLRRFENRLTRDQALQARVGEIEERLKRNSTFND